MKTQLHLSIILFIGMFIIYISKYFESLLLQLIFTIIAISMCIYAVIRLRQLKKEGIIFEDERSRKNMYKAGYYTLYIFFFFITFIFAFDYTRNINFGDSLWIFVLFIWTCLLILYYYFSKKEDVV